MNLAKNFCLYTILTTEENNRQLETSILTMGGEKVLGGS